MIGPLQAGTEFSQDLARLVGGVLLLGVVVYWWVTRSAGRVGEERTNEGLVSDGLSALPKTPVVTAKSDEELESFLSDLDYLAQQTDVGTRRDRVRNRLRSFGSPVAGHAVPVEDADGRIIHLASVSGLTLAHRDPEVLMVDVRRVAEARLAGERVPATFSEYYACDVAEGRVDINETRSRVRGDCKTRIQDNMAREGELDKGALVDRLVYGSGFRYPRNVVDEKLSELISRDIREHKDGTLEWQRF